MPMESRIFLIGFMGSGKTTLGRRLARLTGYSFTDMDQLIEETAGMTIPEIFSELGEKVFRKWERDVLLELCEREKHIISTGGGAPCHGDLMDLMNAAGLTVYLELPPLALKERLLHGRTERPLIKGLNEKELMKYIRDTLTERNAYYRQAKLIMEGVSPNLDALVAAMKAT